MSLESSVKIELVVVKEEPCEVKELECSPEREAGIKEEPIWEEVNETKHVKIEVEDESFHRPVVQERKLNESSEQCEVKKEPEGSPEREASIKEEPIWEDVDEPEYIMIVVEEESLRHPVLQERKLIESSGDTDDCIKYCNVTQQDGSQVHACTVCGKAFKRRELFRQHYRRVHLKLKKNKYPCALCKEEQFPWLRAKHMEDAHGIEAPTCGACGRKFPFQNTLERHQKVFHLGEKNFKCDQCDMVFAERKGLKRHSYKHSDVRNYKCELCLKTFKAPKYLSTHLKIHLNDKRHVCKICGDAFVQTSSLKYHMAKRHPDVYPATASSGLRDSTVTRKREPLDHTDTEATEPELCIKKEIFECEKCGDRFTQESNLTSHLQEHANARFLCDICKTGFRFKCLLVNHMRIHTGEKPFSCKICKKSYRERNHLNHHYKTHTAPDEKPFSCETCKKQFRLKRHLSNHLRTHTNEKPFTCDICLNQYKHKESLAEHRKKHFGKFTCDVCNKEFTSKRGRNIHLLTHSDVPRPEGKPLPCEICNKSFKHSRALYIHKQIHTAVRPHSCDICNKTFLKKHLLDVHKRVHTGEKPYKCKTCNKQFRVMHQLTYHQRVHTGLTPYTCDVCKKQFKHKSNFKQHILTHTKDQPYCEICKKHFMHKASLVTHLRIHTGEKPFACEICKRRFKDKRYLPSHMRTHTGEKPYACDVCDKRFALKTGLTEHKRTHTGEKRHSCELCKKQFVEKRSMIVHMHKCKPK